jgi:hypothetical protein
VDGAPNDISVLARGWSFFAKIRFKALHEHAHAAQNARQQHAR